MQLPRLPHRPHRGPRDCTCGHSPRAHEHYRRGSDCALCACARFRAGLPAAPVADQQDHHDERVHAA